MEAFIGDAELILPALIEESISVFAYACILVYLIRLRVRVADVL